MCLFLANTNQVMVLDLATLQYSNGAEMSNDIRGGGFAQDGVFLYVLVDMIRLGFVIEILLYLECVKGHHLSRLGSTADQTGGQ